MGAALDLIVIPILVMVAVVILGMWTDFSGVTVFAGAVVIALAVGVGIGLLRTEKHVEEDEGIDNAPDQPKSSKGQNGV